MAGEPEAETIIAQRSRPRKSQQHSMRASADFPRQASLRQGGCRIVRAGRPLHFKEFRASCIRGSRSDLAEAVSCGFRTLGLERHIPAFSADPASSQRQGDGGQSPENFLPSSCIAGGGDFSALSRIKPRASSSLGQSQYFP
jgi:hypothetical protein